MKLKNKFIRIGSNKYGVLLLTVYDKKPEANAFAKGVQFKFDGEIGKADVEISIPPKCKREYAKIIAIR